MTASRYLSNAGYTNVYNIQGVNQWTFGLMYDDPTFRFRRVNAGEEGDIAAATTGTSPAGIGYDAAGNALRWYNVPRAKFNIYAFTTATETDPANAVVTKTLNALPALLDGSGAEWRQVRKFDLATLGLKGGTYYLRVQALPEVDAPVKGYTPETIWGAPSKLSDAVQYKAPAEDITFLKIDAPSMVTATRNSICQFNVNLNVGASDEDLLWSISDTSFAVVNNGNVAILNKMGIVVLTATDPKSGISHSVVLRIT